jgi:hypothetical protein
VVDVIPRHEEPGYVLLSWRNVLINRWTGPITLEALAAGRRVGDALEQEFGPSIGAMTIVASSVPSPPDTVRRQAADDMKRASHRMKVAATVIEGAGFRASAMRSAYATLNLFARTNHPTKVTGSLEVAAEFVGAGLGHSAAEIRALLDAASSIASR